MLSTPPLLAEASSVPLALFAEAGEQARFGSSDHSAESSPLVPLEEIGRASSRAKARAIDQIPTASRSGTDLVGVSRSPTTPKSRPEYSEGHLHGTYIESPDPTACPLLKLWITHPRLHGARPYLRQHSIEALLVVSKRGRPGRAEERWPIVVIGSSPALTRTYMAR